MHIYYLIIMLVGILFGCDGRDQNKLSGSLVEHVDLKHAYIVKGNCHRVLYAHIRIETKYVRGQKTRKEMDVPLPHSRSGTVNFRQLSIHYALLKGRKPFAGGNILNYAFDPCFYTKPGQGRRRLLKELIYFYNYKLKGGVTAVSYENGRWYVYYDFVNDGETAYIQFTIPEALPQRLPAIIDFQRIKENGAYDIPWTEIPVVDGPGKIEINPEFGESPFRGRR